ncbi:ABC transporter substrate-binding protein [Halohasta salina]|uniref:ABC transporter substrate-binding protein n=1 Tax=Halohasta salina TaxID=2961621 RepID=UPI0020A5F5A9|nr:ABC transporter substrate-binding protein [Halohasta salina]
MSSDRSVPISRRGLLAGAAASGTATAGCLGRIRETLGGSGTTQVSLDIKTLPVDSDPFAVPIARALIDNLEAVGIDASLQVMDVTQLSEQVLLNHDFDIYVGQFPYARPPDPDALYPMFRSTFATELGWQNPFGFANLRCDDLLDAQRTAAAETREEPVAELQAFLARTQPMTPVVAPEVVTGVRTDRFTNWDPDDREAAGGGPVHPHNLLQLEGVDGAPRTLRLATVDDRLTTNRNPISAVYQQQESLLDLVYDSLALDTGTEYVPWLARDVSWSDDPPTVDIELREGLVWHDGRRLSAYDVGFTYEFLRDTSLGGAIRAIPTERFRGRISLVEDVTVESAHELSLTLSDTSRAVARRALTVPILPAHVWRDRTAIERPPGRAGGTTAALTSNNSSAIGSGPLRFESAGGGEVVFSRFEPHFLWRSATTPTDAPNGTASRNGTDPSTDTDLSTNTTVTQPTDAAPTAPNGTSRSTGEAFAPPPEAYGGLPPFDTVVVQTVSSDASAAELVAAGDADATATKLSGDAVAQLDDSQAVEPVSYRSNAFYHLGFNTRRQPLRNPNVRRLVARLVDKSRLAGEVFGGNGQPIASPLAATDWLADDLVWDDETDADPEVPFLGTDGELAVETARERFRDIGYEYNADDQLITERN